jgi:hypothetical protein
LLASDATGQGKIARRIFSVLPIAIRMPRKSDPLDQFGFASAAARRGGKVVAPQFAIVPSVATPTSYVGHISPRVTNPPDFRPVGS